MIGFLNINKPSKITSNYVVTNIKKRLKIKKVGHFGTLDPLASGVLPIAIGKATKLFDYFLEKDKVYIATFEFGYLTDTLDSEGKIEKTTQIIPNEKEINDILKGFIGKQSQMPPKFSAKNINGVRAYELARKGEEVVLKPKEIEIYDIKLIEKIDETKYKFYIHCSSGTYIRSIARDLGERLNSLATMIALIREKSGFFELKNAVSLDCENIENKVVAIEEVLKDLPKVNIPIENYKKLLNGVSVDYKDDVEECLVYCNNELFGIGYAKDKLLKIKIYLKE